MPERNLTLGSRALITEAVNLAELHGLRAYDAVQLAAARQLQRERQAFKLPALVWVSAALALNPAATAEGLLVEDPNHH